MTAACASRRQHASSRFVRSLVLGVWLLAGVAGAEGDAELVGLINDYRAAPRSCDGKRMPMAGVVTPAPVLTHAPLADGTGLTAALADAGYHASRVRMITISGPSRASAVMGLLEQRYCASLLDRRYSEIGVSRDGVTWRIVLAHPLLAADLGDWREAGKTVLGLVNEARGKPRICGDQRFAAAPAVAWNEKLAAAALAHSGEMATRNDFSHTGQNGNDVAVRAQQQGYRWRSVGENIAAGQGSAQKVVAGWLASPGHCANIMNPAFVEMGAAYATNPDSDMIIYWTQVFAQPAP